MPQIPADLLNRAQSGDLDAQTAFVRLYQREVRSFLAMVSADLAAVDDLAQETFLRALDRLDRIAQPDSTAAFLKGIARNVTLEHARRQRRQAERAEKFVRMMEDLGGGTAEGDWWSDDTRLTGALETCLGQLPERSRSILNWRYKEDYDATEIAGRLNTTSTAVRATLKRVRLSLWQCIRGRYEGAAG